MLTSLQVDEFASCLACPSYLVLLAVSGFLVILVLLGLLGVFDFPGTSLQADKCRFSFSARSFPQ